MLDKEELEYIRCLTDHGKETVRFLSNANKADRERIVCAAFLRSLGVDFSVEHLVPVAQKMSPPDVKFGTARFEVCEVLDKRRKRHYEARSRVDCLRRAKTIEDTYLPVRAKTPLLYPEVFTLVTNELARKANRYGRKVCSELDALICVHLLNRYLDPNSSPPRYANLLAQGWRSVSFFHLPYSHVIYAAESAPDFLRHFAGQTRKEWNHSDTFYKL